MTFIAHYETEEVVSAWTARWQSISFGDDRAVVICVAAIANTGSSKMVSDWGSSQAPTYSGRISAKKCSWNRVGTYPTIAKQSFDN